MNLIALLIGLAIERLATHLFHWRRLRWLDRIIDAGFRQSNRLANWPPIIPVIALAILLVLPVAAVIYSLGETLQGFTYLLLAIVVLLFSIGPKDIGEEVGEYCKALESEDDEKINNASKAIIEGEVPADARERISCVEAAVCVQANNRLFAVIFWFVILGPLAAWAYRVTDLIRRRAVFTASRDEEGNGGAERIRNAAELVHGSRRASRRWDTRRPVTTTTQLPRCGHQPRTVTHRRQYAANICSHVLASQRWRLKIAPAKALPNAVSAVQRQRTSWSSGSS